VLAGRLRTISPVTLLLLVVPFTWAVRDTRELTKTDTRIVALERIGREVSGGVFVLDPGLPAPAGVNVVRLELPARGWEPDERRSLAGLRRLGPSPTHIWVNGSVVDRVRAASDEYPRERRFYGVLEGQARLVFRIDDEERYGGPWTALYELPPQLASPP
jgi:hypothetical protein